MWREISASRFPRPVKIAARRVAFFQDEIDAWLAEIAPSRDHFKHKGRFESSASVHFQSLLLHHQVIVAFTEGRLDLGPNQAVLFVELDGLRPKRILVKVMGE